MDGQTLYTVVQRPEKGTNLKPFVSILEFFESLTTVGAYAQKEDAVSMAVNSEGRPATIQTQNPSKTATLHVVKRDQDEVQQQELINKILRRLVYQATAELKQKSQVQMVEGSRPTNEEVSKEPKAIVLSEDDDAGNLSSNRKTQRNKATLVGEMLTSFRLPEDFPVNNVDLDKLTAPPRLLERLKANVKYEKRFTFSQRQENWKLERKLRSNGKTYDTYFLHLISNESVRSVVEIANFIMYEIHPCHLKKTVKGSSKEYNSSVSTIKGTSKEDNSSVSTVKGTSKEDNSSLGSKSFKRTRSCSRGKKLWKKMSKIHSPEGSIPEEHVRYVMEFLREAFENLNSKKDIELVPSNSSKSIDSLAQKIDAILCNHFKEVNMLDLYLASKRNVKEDDDGVLVSYDSVDNFLAREVDDTLYKFFEKENMLDVYLASKRMRTEVVGHKQADSMKAMVDDSLAQKFDEVLHRLFKELNFQDLNFANKKLRTKDEKLSSESKENMDIDNSLDNELDDTLHHFLKEANLMDLYLESERVKTKESEENDQKSTVVPSPNSLSETSEKVNKFVAPSPDHVAAIPKQVGSSDTQTLDTSPDAKIAQENNNMLPVPAVDIAPDQKHNKMPVPDVMPAINPVEWPDYYGDADAYLESLSKFFEMPDQFEPLPAKEYNEQLELAEWLVRLSQ